MLKKILKVIFPFIFIAIILILSYTYVIDKDTTEYENEPQNINSKKEAKLTLVGDLLFEQPFYDAVSNGYDEHNYFSLVKNYFAEDDLSIGNMEVVVGNDLLKPSGTGYNFCAPEYIGDLVSTLDFEVLSTANNHAYDRGIDGVFSTIDYFKNNTDILTVGTYKNEDDRNNYRIIEINNLKFGILAYTYGTNQKIASEYTNLIGLYKDPTTKQITEEYKNIIKEEINTIKKISDIVIVLMHWGVEFTYEPSDEQVEMSYFLNSLGVDIIVGSHSHSMQPVEIIGSDHLTLVYYSLGNFLSADDDIARTEKGNETFDNAYQIGLLSTLEVSKSNNKVEFSNIKVKPIINYFDNTLNNFKLIPYELYTSEYEKTHYRYRYGLNKNFIENTFNMVIDKEYRS